MTAGELRVRNTLVSDMEPQPELSQDRVRSLRESIPLPRLGTPEVGRARVQPRSLNAELCMVPHAGYCVRCRVSGGRQVYNVREDDRGGRRPRVVTVAPSRPVVSWLWRLAQFQSSACCNVNARL
jgi:hypothetical protein